MPSLELTDCHLHPNPPIPTTRARSPLGTRTDPLDFAVAGPHSPRAAALDGPAGYDTRLFIDEIDKQFICSLCSQVLRHAVVINNDPWCVPNSRRDAFSPPCRALSRALVTDLFSTVA